MAAPSSELASVYVTLIPSFRGAQGSIAKAFTGGKFDSEADKVGESIGSKIMGGAVKGLKVATAAVGVLGLAVAGLAAKGGIARQLQIENAEAKLSSLGHSAEAVAAIMGDAMASVKGTAYSMGDAASMAATAVAAGVKPGKDLQRYLSLVGDAATVAGVSMGEMGQIFGKVQTQGRAYTMELNQLADRGIPIYQWLADEYKVTTLELRKMVAAGTVDAATYQKVIETHIGGAALTMGTTTEGAFANMKAALARFGVQLTQWFFPLLKNVYNAATKVLDGVTSVIKPWSEAFSAAFQAKVGPAIDDFAARSESAFKRVGAAVDLIKTGDFTAEIGKALGVEEDAPIVNTLLRLHTAASAVANVFRDELTPAGTKALANTKEFSGFTGVLVNIAQSARLAADSISFLAGGDLSRALRADADAGGTLTGRLIEIRQSTALARAEVTGGLHAMWAAMLEGGTDVTSAGLPGVMERIGLAAHNAVTEVVGGARAMWAAMQSGGTDVTSTGLAGVMETVGLVARALWDALGPTLTTLGPQVLQLASAFSPLGTILRSIEPILPQIAASAVSLATSLGGALAAALPLVVDLVGALAGVLSGALASFLPSMVTLVADLASVLSGVLAAALPVVVSLLETLSGVLSGALGAVLPALAQVATTLAEALGGALAIVLPMVAGLVQSLVEALAPVLPVIASLVGQMASAFAGVLGDALAALLPLVVDLVNGLVTALLPFLPTLVSLVQTVASVFGTLLSAVGPLLPPILTLVDSLMGALLPLLPSLAGLLETVAGVVLTLVEAFSPLEPVLATLIASGFDVLLAVLTPIIEIVAKVAAVLADVLAAAIEAVMPVLVPLIEKFVEFATFIAGDLTAKWGAFAAFLTAAWEWARAGLQAGWDWLNAYVFEPMKTAISVVGAVFAAMRDRITGAWNAVQAGLQAGWGWIDQNVFAPFKAGVALLQSAFSNAGSAIGTIWDGIKVAAAKPVNFILDTVYNNGIRNWWNTIAGAVGLDSLKLDKANLIAFADGGVTPGYTPGRDVHRFFSPTAGWLDLSGGEAIMRPEWTRLVGGPGAVSAMNTAARSGSLLTPGQAFAGGGIFGARRPETGGFPPDWVKKIGSGIASFGKGLWDAGAMAVEILKDPIGAVKKAISEVVERAGSGGHASRVFDIMVEFPGRFAGGLADKVKAMLGDKPRDGAADMPAAGGAPAGALGVARMSEIIRSLVPDARVTSGLRPGAITAVGTPSMHGQGRAIDIAGSSRGDMGAMMRIFTALRTAFPNSTELIHSPAGAAQLYKGRSMVYGEPTKSMHYDHVHWGMKTGGVVPKLYDQGGWLPPGRSVVENRTGNPEPVFTGGQFDALLGAKADGRLAEIVNITGPDARSVADELERRQRQKRLASGLVGRSL